MPIELFYRSGPRPALLKLRADNQCCVRQSVNELVALHGVPDVEGRRGVVRASQDKSAIHQRSAKFMACGSAFEAIGKHTRNCTPSVQRTPHCGLIDTTGTTRDHCAPRFGGKPPYALRVGDQGFGHVSGADDSQATRGERRALSATVQDRRSRLSQSSLEPSWVFGISAADDPKRTRAPTLQRLAEQNASLK